ncbi:MAG: hypothetical protein NC311_10640, partial [Muribaculaceae bacterium]|nr:hypothetical protein [Muribaculaceae bacterium]
EGVKEALAEQKQPTEGELMRERIKVLLKRYRLLRASHADKVYDLETLNEHPEARFDEIEDMMQNVISKRAVKLAGVEDARARTHLGIANIESALNDYRNICLGSALDTERRRWRVLEARFLTEFPHSTKDIAEDEFVTERTIQTDIQAAVDDLCVLFRGIDGLRDLLE